MKNIQKYLIAGLLVWLPIVVTVLLFRFLISLMDQTLILLPPQIRPESLLGFSLPGLGVILTLLVLLVTGIFAANIVGKTMVGFGERALKRIPIVRSVYSAAKNFSELVFLKQVNRLRRSCSQSTQEKEYIVSLFRLRLHQVKCKRKQVQMWFVLLCRQLLILLPDISLFYLRKMLQKWI